MKLVVFTHRNAAANAFPSILAEWFAREFGLVFGTRILVLATVYTSAAHVLNQWQRRTHLISSFARVRICTATKEARLTARLRSLADSHKRSQRKQSQV